MEKYSLMNLLFPLSQTRSFPVKKIAAAALAATMTLSVAAVPAEAASNTMSEYNTKCTLRLDGQRGGTVARNQVRNN